MKHLIIVESPAKAKTIKSFLGDDYEVIASKGHIRDLPKHSFGIKIEAERFEPQYRIDKEHSAVVKQIKDLAKKSSTVYIATDEDREGEAIGYHIAKAIGKEPEALPRIVFHEITKSAIRHAIENPRNIDMDRVNAQQARRLLDRIVGYKLSPLLASKIQRGLSAGRVQSASLKIIVDREREIRAFIPVEYWSLDALFQPTIEAILVEYAGKKIEKMSIGSKEEAQAIEQALAAGQYRVASIETKQRKSSTPPPFMTSTLQQSASGQLGFSPKKTMMIAQRLYEGVNTDQGQMGVITYMRTDSLNIAKEAQEAARSAILERYGKNYLPDKPKFYASKSKGAQEAHEAIRPTRIDFPPSRAKAFLNGDELKLYTLIYNRFLASQMTDARFESQTILIACDQGVFKAMGRKLVFDGFYKILGSEEKDKLLPELSEGQEIAMKSLKANQHFTEPPARYTEASLIKKLEALGIGRPSTYAPTVSLLVAREYIAIEKRQLVPQDISFTVIEALENHFADIVDAGFTANMEEKLDGVAEHNEDWQKLLYDFYTPFLERIEVGKTQIKSLKKADPIGRKCPECGSELLLRSGRYGDFIACSAYPKCRYTEAVEQEEGDADGGKTPKPVETDEVCDKCGAPMVVKNGRRGSFLACSAYPKCKNTRPLEKPKALDIPCPECGGALIERASKRGKFFGCSNYPTCTFISKFAPTDVKCPECGYPMARRTLRGKEVYECIKCKHKTAVDDVGQDA